MIIMERQTEFIDSPQTLHEDIVQNYCRHTKDLARSQVSKALRFVKYGCIRYIKDIFPEKKSSFVCLPLNTKESHTFGNVTITKDAYPKDYNKQEYLMFKDENGIWHCNCQSYDSKERNGKIDHDGVVCSHLAALFYCFKLKRFTKQHGVDDEEQKIEDWMLEED